VFVSGGTNAGAPNVWWVNGLPEGVDRLHNVGFDPAVHVAILLGDVYGDGIHTNFGLYHAEGPDFGQGVFATPFGTEAEPDAFSGVDGAQLIQFAPYGYNSQQAGLVEMRHPAGHLRRGGRLGPHPLYLSGVMVSINTNTQQQLSVRQISGSVHRVPESGGAAGRVRQHRHQLRLSVWAACRVAGGLRRNPRRAEFVDRRALAGLDLHGRQQQGRR
jgi:hypothetical protein